MRGYLSGRKRTDC